MVFRIGWQQSRTLTPEWRKTNRNKKGELWLHHLTPWKEFPGGGAERGTPKPSGLAEWRKLTAIRGEPGSHNLPSSVPWRRELQRKNSRDLQKDRLSIAGWVLSTLEWDWLGGGQGRRGRTYKKKIQNVKIFHFCGNILWEIAGPHPGLGKILVPTSQRRTISTWS